MSVHSGEWIVIPLPEDCKVRDRLAVSKETKHRFHKERFNLKELNVAEHKERYIVEISNRFSVWKIWALVDATKKNIKMSATESPYFY
jgi:hypothetical protein